MVLRANKGLYFILVILLAFAACETSLDFELHAVPKLTIISHLSPDNSTDQRVYVYASQTPTDSSHFYTPDDLVVDVTESASGVHSESDVTIRLDTTYTNGKLYFTFPIGFVKAGYRYSITAFAPGFDIVQATTVIPKPSTITNLSIRDVLIEQSEAHEFKKIIRYKLVFNIDHFESNRYYHLVFYNQYKGLEDLYLVNPQPSDNQPFIQHHDYGVLVDRKDLNEGEPLTFEFQDWVVNNHDLIRVYVELRTITQDYYKYHSSLARQLSIRPDPFAEPVFIFNNIEGGYGNFSGFSPNISSSDLPE